MGSTLYFPLSSGRHALYRYARVGPSQGTLLCRRFSTTPNPLRHLFLSSTTPSSMCRHSDTLPHRENVPEGPLHQSLRWCTTSQSRATAAEDGIVKEDTEEPVRLRQQRLVEIVEEKRLDGHRVAFSIRCRPFVAHSNSARPETSPGSASTRTSHTAAPAAERYTTSSSSVAMTSGTTPTSDSSRDGSVVPERKAAAPVPSQPHPSRSASSGPIPLPSHNTTPVPVLPLVASLTEPVKRVILIRCGANEAMQDSNRFVSLPDWSIPLLPEGRRQCFQTGRDLAELIGGEPLYFYHSPYVRARQSLEELLQGYREGQLERRQRWRESGDPAVPLHQPHCEGNQPPSLTSQKSGDEGMEMIQGIREDSRLRDGDIGRYKNLKDFEFHKKARTEYGTFFYRYPHGESGADVCDRVTSFLEAFQRERVELRQDTNVIVLTHDIVIRMFIKRWFHLNVETYHRMCSFSPGSMSTLSRVHHQSCFRLNEECVEALNLPSSLNESNGYRFRNKDFLGSISSGAPFM